MEHYQPPQQVYAPGSPPQPQQQPVESQPQAPIKPPRSGNIRGALTTVLILLMAPILALSITTFVFQSYEVDGPSMEPTLFTHERLIIWKVGRTWSRLTKNEYIPERGTVIVFIKRGLYDFENSQEKQLIKRIVGLPGERVVIKDGTITVFNDQNPSGFNPDLSHAHGADINEKTDGNVDITVDPGHVFVVGDNRDNSLDSRSFGAIPVRDIIGTLSLRILPIGEVKKF